MNVREIEKERKFKCEHEKVYANYELTTYPPQKKWICRKCGQEGTDITYNSNEETYEEVYRKFKG